MNNSKKTGEEAANNAVYISGSVSQPHTELDSGLLHSRVLNEPMNLNRVKVFDIFLARKKKEQQSALPPTVALKLPTQKNIKTINQEPELLNIPLDAALHPRARKYKTVNEPGANRVLNRSKNRRRSIVAAMLIFIVVTSFFVFFRSGPLPKLIKKEFNNVTFFVPEDADLVSGKSTTLVRLYTNSGKDITVTNEGDGIVLQKDNSKAYYAEKVVVGDYQDVVTGDFENKQEVLDQLENIYKKTDSETDDCVSGFSNDFAFKSSDTYRVEFRYRVDCLKNKNNISQVEMGRLVVKDRTLVFISFTTSKDLYDTEKGNIEKILTSIDASL